MDATEASKRYAEAVEGLEKVEKRMQAYAQWSFSRSFVLSVMPRVISLLIWMGFLYGIGCSIDEAGRLSVLVASVAGVCVSISVGCMSLVGAGALRSEAENLALLLGQVRELQRRGDS